MMYFYKVPVTTGRTNIKSMIWKVGEGPFQALYDLKGCADDKTLLRDGLRIKSIHKRFYKPQMWFGKVFH